MSDTTTPEIESAFETSVTVEDVGPSRKKLTIEVAAEAVDGKLGESLDMFTSEAEIPGFRKGRAPRQLIQKRFGNMMRDQTKGQIAQEAYRKAIEEHELKIVGEPSAEMLGDVELEAGKPLKFEVEVEVQPDFDLPGLEGIDVYKPLIEVTDESVEKEIEKLAINEGDLEERETPEAGDYLTGHGVMKTADGETTFHDIEGAVVRVPLADDNGRGMILGVMVEDFEKQLGLPKPGETATVKATGPEQHENEDIRGKDLVVTFAVERVDRIIPASLEEVAKRYGLPDEETLRTGVKARMSQRVIVEQHSVMHRQLANHFLREVEMELPERLTANQAGRNLERRRVDLLYRGVDAMEIEQHIAELRAASSATAVRDLKLFFILGAIAEELGVQVQEAEINGRIAQIAQQRGERPEQVRDQIIKSRQVGAIVQQIRDHKVFDAVLSKSKIEELSLDDYNQKVSSVEGKDTTESATTEGV
ncbi:MAG: trigger factor [Planctomycetota bacterium]